MILELNDLPDIKMRCLGLSHDLALKRISYTLDSRPALPAAVFFAWLYVDGNNWRDS